MPVVHDQLHKFVPAGLILCSDVIKLGFLPRVMIHRQLSISQE